MKQNAVIEHLKQKKTMTPAEREENQRFVSGVHLHGCEGGGGCFTCGLTSGGGAPEGFPHPSG